MTEKIMRDASTLKIMRDVTGKLMRAGLTASCWLCPNHTPAQVTADFTGVQLLSGCHFVVPGLYLTMSWINEKNINDSIWTLNQNYDHHTWGPLGECGYGVTIEAAVHIDYYSDSSCLNLINSIEANMVIIAAPGPRDGPPPHVGGTAIAWVWDQKNNYWYSLYVQANEDYPVDSECLNITDMPAETGTGTVTLADVV